MSDISIKPSFELSIKGLTITLTHSEATKLQTVLNDILIRDDTPSPEIDKLYDRTPNKPLETTYQEVRPQLKDVLRKRS